MKHSTKILLNTLASYARIIVSAFVTLVSTRLALKYLGVSDFGLYNLIAGVIAMLSFFNGSLMISSQRYFSISLGAGDNVRLNRYFNASLGIHIVMGVILGVFLLLMLPFLFNGFLNIPVEKKNVAIYVYNIMMVSSVVTIATIPFSAIMNAKEDMVPLSFIDIIHCLGKLIAAFTLMFVHSQLLLTYSVVLLGSVIVKMFLEILWVKRNYTVININKSFFFDKDLCKSMMGFVGWNTLGSVAIIARNQGIAVTLNFFFGTVINAAYGIANQVNSMVLSFASTLTTVFTPMIIQAKGAGDEKKMITVAVLSSKLSFMLSSLIALPILLFLQDILLIWLKEIPNSTFEFCVFMILSFLIQQLYPGINRVIYACGQIRGYQIVISILLLLTIPAGCFLFSCGYEPYFIMIGVLIAQILTFLATVLFAHKICGLSVIHFVYRNTLYPIAIFCIVYYCCRVAVIANSAEHPDILFIVGSSMAACSLYVAAYYVAVIEKDEKKIILQSLWKRF